MNKCLAALVAVPFALLDLSGASAQSAQQTESLRVAQIAPLTGSSADTYGASMLAGLNCVFDEVNAQGGVPIAGRRYKIDYKVYDDKFRADEVQAAARRALNDGYKFIIGPIGSGVASAAQPLMARSDAFWMISPPSVPGPTRNPNVFRPAALISAYSEATLDWLKAHPELKRIALITDQAHTGLVSAEPDLVAGIKALGREVVIQQKSKLGDTDFRAPITEAMSVKPDLYILRVYSVESALMTQQIRELGGKMLVQWNAGVGTADARALVKDLSILKDVTQVSPLLALDVFLTDGNKLAEKVAACAEKRKGNGSFTTAGHDTAVIFLEGLKRASAPTPDAMIKALAELKAADVAGKTLNVYESQDGGLVFKDREVHVRAVMQVWREGAGWVRTR
ncbi:MAG: ABC transporter substrate-binding protein [Lautropia sp.]